MGLKFDDGQEGNQFSEINCQFSILGVWRWRCRAGGFVGTLRLENLLRRPCWARRENIGLIALTNGMPTSGSWGCYNCNR